MTLELLRAFFGWCAILNLILLMVWFGLFVGARGALFRLHGRWFNLAPQTFDAIHYAGMAGYKLSLWMFFLIPYLVLRFFL